MSTFAIITPSELKARLHDGGEIAVLDAREEADFATSHLLLAASVPLSRMELLLADRVPRRSARVVWMDAGEGYAERAAERSLAAGYDDVSVLAGGVEAWRMAGHPVYTGVHVPSKAFAEVVEHEQGTPWISAEELARTIERDPQLTIVDSRSFEEYRSGTIPGSVSCPGAELVYRVREMVPSPDSLVVVNCGGRTRSIIGAQSLINAGLPNPVVSMRDGTMAWHLAGFEVASGSEARAPAPASTDWAREAAARVAARFEVQPIDAAGLAAWLADADRTTYVVDVRTPEEFAAGHIAEARSVPGGQLVQETDRHCGVWGARVVLTDDDGVRAAMTASWLAQMGWEVRTFVPPADHPRVRGPRAAPTVGLEGVGGPAITVDELARALEAGEVEVVDIGPSDGYERAHVPGAWFATRARVEFGRTSLPAGARLVITCPDGALASPTAGALAGTGTDARALSGGTAAWVAAGRPTECGLERTATPVSDSWRAPRRSADPDRREAQMREYLSWETALVHVIAHDDDRRYRRFGD